MGARLRVHLDRAPLAERVARHPHRPLRQVVDVNPLAGRAVVAARKHLELANDAGHPTQPFDILFEQLVEGVETPVHRLVELEDQLGHQPPAVLGVGQEHRALVVHLVGDAGDQAPEGGVALGHLQPPLQLLGPLARHRVLDGARQDHLAELGLAHVVLCTGVETIHCQGVVVERGQRDHRGLAGAPDHPLDQRQPLAVGQAQIEQHSIVRPGIQSFERGLQGGHVIQLQLYPRSQQVEHQPRISAIIFDEQQMPALL